MERLLGMIDYLYQLGRCTALDEDLISFFGVFSKTSMRVLLKAQDLWKERITNHVKIECLRMFEKVGEILIIAAAQLQIEEKFIEVHFINFLNFGLFLQSKIYNI